MKMRFFSMARTNQPHPLAKESDLIRHHTCMRMDRAFSYRPVMTVEELEQSALSGAAMPSGLSPARQALWMARAGKWHEAHELCQNISGSAGSWIHAHLHREEGDHGNAAYWYSRAGKPVPVRGLSIEEEWRELAAAL